MPHLWQILPGCTLYTRQVAAAILFGSGPLVPRSLTTKTCVSIHQSRTDVLQESLHHREQAPKFFHSDQGSEYASQSCIQWLVKHGIAPFWSPKGKPWTNGRQESFFSSFKLEFGRAICFKTIEDLIEGIGKYIHYYNTDRIHSAHKMPPRVFYESGEWKKQKRISKGKLNH